MSTVRLTVTARATDSNLCYAHIKLMQQKAHIELMLLAFKGHTSRPPSVRVSKVVADHDSLLTQSRYVYT